MRKKRNHSGLAADSTGTGLRRYNGYIGKGKLTRSWNLEPGSSLSAKVTRNGGEDTEAELRYKLCKECVHSLGISMLKLQFPLW